jgi:hypothetical protein
MPSRQHVATPNVEIMMKKPRPDLQNRRIIRIAREFFLLPFTLVAGIYAVTRRWRQGTKSEKVVRDEDALRQSRARRELRGLPPDHVQAAHVKSD